MKILDRYVARQILVTSAFAVAVLSIVLVLGNILKELLDLVVNHDVPLEYIFSFIGYIVPFSLTFTIPWGFLTAVLLVFGRMSAENELIAMRTAGISIPRICASLGVIALVSCGLCLWINLDVAPRAEGKMKGALFNIATSNPLVMFSSDQIIDEFPGRRIYVEKKEGTELQNLLIYEINEDSEPIRVVFARRGELETDLENQQVLLKLSDARFEQRDDMDPKDFSKIRQGITMAEGVLPISLQELYEKNRKRRGLTQMTLSELLKNPDPEERGETKVEVNRRFSLSFASLAFALVGVPLAITAHRKETSTGFFFSLAVAFSYFFFIILANMMKDKPGVRPEILIWAPNFIFLSLGIFLFWRLMKK